MKRQFVSPIDLLGTANVPLSSNGDGCDLHPKCLTCPFAMCQYDLPEPTDRLYSDPKHSKWLVVALVFLDEINPEATEAEIAKQFSTSLFDAKCILEGVRWIRNKLDEDYENDPFTIK